MDLHLKLSQGNAAAAILGLTLLAALFIGMYAMLQPFSMMYEKFGDSEYSAYTQAECDAHLGTWDGTCHQLDSRASSLLVKVRYYWLIAPIIFAIGILIWIISVATRRDPQFYNPGGPFG
jgi:hypothetical protein